MITRSLNCNLPLNYYWSHLLNIKVCLTNIRTVPSEHPLPIYSILIKSPPFLFKSCPISQLPHKGHQCSQSVNRSLILVHMFPHIIRTAVPFMVRFLEEGQTTPLTLLVFPRYCCCSPSDLRFSFRGIIAVASAHFHIIHYQQNDLLNYWCVFWLHTIALTDMRVGMEYGHSLI